ncbi:MAG: radical SAM protein [Spirochaetales bacterium]|nr:radical SAM protein [Spirochaetales bacterium]
MQLLATPAREKSGLSRSFKTLRLSVTPACNLACTYCNPAAIAYRGELKPPAFYSRIVADLLQTQGISQIQITGGEPSLYPHLSTLIEMLCSLPVERVSLTTNGLALQRRALEWRAAGLTDINVSLDALNRETFQEMTGSKEHELVLCGIQTARSLGFPLKINATILRHHNEREIVPLLLYADRNGCTVRFLELMAMGPLQENHSSLFFSRAEILNAIEQHFPVEILGRPPGGTAEYFRAGSIRFGIIANHSASFCEDCDRLRVLHDGSISGCLSSRQRYSFAQESRAGQERALALALGDKTRTFTGSSESMQALGG